MNDRDPATKGASGFIETLRSLRPWFVETLKKLFVGFVETLSDQLDALAQSLRGGPDYDSTFMVGGFNPDKDPDSMTILSVGPDLFADDAHRLVGLLELPPCGTGEDGLLDHEWKLEDFEEPIERLLEDPWVEVEGAGRVPLSDPTKECLYRLSQMIAEGKAVGLADRVALQMTVDD